jgi:hypothetical protein
MSTVIVSGAIANKYLKAGEAWHRLQWVLGLRRLGFTVYFVEQIAPQNCLDAAGAVTTLENSVNLAYLKAIAEAFGWPDSAILVHDNGKQIYGIDHEGLLDLAEETDVLINISGHLTLQPLLCRVRRKVYIDEDPGFTQFWQAAGNPGLHLEGYDFYFTIGENLGRPECSIPTCGIRWRPTRPFVVLEQWPLIGQGDCHRFTTIGSWRGPYGPVEYGGRTYGLKVHEFRKFLELPRRTAQTFELALDIHAADEKDRSLLHEHGWRVVDPRETVPDPQAFRRYIQASAAEFSVAKGVYVETKSGWFSDRTVRYLASGKPALIQDTGFIRNYPVGAGLVPFRTLDEAVAGARRIVADYHEQSRAARALAEEYFDSDKVLGRLMDEVGIAP